MRMAELERVKEATPAFKELEKAVLSPIWQIVILLIPLTVLYSR